MRAHRLFKKAVRQGRSKAHGVTNKWRHVCARRRVVSWLYLEAKRD